MNPLRRLDLQPARNSRPGGQRARLTGRFPVSEATSIPFSSLTAAKALIDDPTFGQTLAVLSSGTDRVDAVGLRGWLEGLLWKSDGSSRVELSRLFGRAFRLGPRARGWHAKPG